MTAEYTENYNLYTTTVCRHCLQDCLKDRSHGDIETMVEETLSDEEEGVPHCVSDSESESKNDS